MIHQGKGFLQERLWRFGIRELIQRDAARLSSLQFGEQSDGALERLTALEKIAPGIGPLEPL